MHECHKSWRLLLDKAEQGEVKSNLSVSKLSDLASDVEPENVAEHFMDNDDKEGQEYPASLVA